MLLVIWRQTDRNACRKYRSHYTSHEIVSEDHSNVGNTQYPHLAASQVPGSWDRARIMDLSRCPWTRLGAFRILVLVVAMQCFKPGKHTLNGPHTPDCVDASHLGDRASMCLVLAHAVDGAHCMLERCKKHGLTQGLIDEVQYTRERRLSAALLVCNTIGSGIFTGTQASETTLRPFHVLPPAVLAESFVYRSGNQLYVDGNLFYHMGINAVW